MLWKARPTTTRGSPSSSVPGKTMRLSSETPKPPPNGWMRTKSSVHCHTRSRVRAEDSCWYSPMVEMRVFHASDVSAATAKAPAVINSAASHLRRDRTSVRTATAASPTNPVR